MAEIPEPKTRLEQYWAGILDKIDGGGGGNPNYVETIEGTLANPWGGVDTLALHQSVRSGDATVKLGFDATELGFGPVEVLMSPFVPDAIVFSGVMLTGTNVQSWVALTINYELDGTLAIILVLRNGTVTNMSQYATNLSTVLTVIHHPLPDSGT